MGFHGFFKLFFWYVNIFRKIADIRSRHSNERAPDPEKGMVSGPMNQAGKRQEMADK